MNDFELSEGEIFKLWKHFIRMDKQGKGFINIG